MYQIKKHKAIGEVRVEICLVLHEGLARRECWADVLLAMRELEKEIEYIHNRMKELALVFL